MNRVGLTSGTRRIKIACMYSEDYGIKRDFSMPCPITVKCVRQDSDKRGFLKEVSG